MSDEQLTQEEWDYAVKAAQKTRFKHPDVDTDEVLGEVGEWIAYNWDKIFRWRETEDGVALYRKAIKDEAAKAAGRVLQFQRSKGIVYDKPDTHLKDNYRYSHAELRSIIPYAIYDDWHLGKNDAPADAPRGGGDPAQANNWQDAMLDVRDAFFSLSNEGMALLSQGAAVGWDWEKLADLLGSVGSEAARKSVQRQLDKMREFLGNSSVRIYGDYAGTRNNPQYDDSAARQERAVAAEWMS